MEKTLIILKPDTVQRNIAGAVISRIESRGYKIVAMKMMLLDMALIREHYAHLVTKPFFPEIVDYMTAGPVIVMIIEGENVIAGMRQLCGATNPAEALMGTVRADFANNIRYNLIHASDSEEGAEAEIQRFFRADEICTYERKIME